MNWNYRVVREVHPSIVRGHGPTITYSILEVYYENKGDEVPTSWIEEKAHLTYLGSKQELHSVLTDMLPVAMTKPTLYKTTKEKLVLEEDYEGLLTDLDRLKGCLLGCAVGDALGVPLERRDPETVKETLPAGDLGFYGVPWTFSKEQEWRHNKGQYSDDTQLSKLVLSTVRDGGGTFDPDLYCQKLIELHDSGNPVGFGKGTLESIERLKQGTPWNEAGSPAPSAGNGAAMKAAIIGALFDELDQVVETTIEASLPTHRSPEAIAGAVAVSVMAWHLKNTESRYIQEAELLRVVAVDIKEIYTPFAEDLLQLATLWEDEHPNEEELLEWTLKTQPPNSSWPGISPYVRPTVLWAMNSFLLSSHNYLGTLRIAMEAGGDVDTTAAIAGALSGVYNGTSAIPTDLISELNDHGLRESDHEHLLNLCDKTYEAVKDIK